MEPSRRKAIHDAMVRLSDGDRSAMDLLVDELWPVILSFAERALRHEQDAEDVAQEVFLRICSRISDFDRNRDGLSWAFGIASYEVMTHRRRQSRRRETLDDAELRSRADPVGSQEEAAIGQELAEALRQAVGSLSEEDRSDLGFVGVPVSIDPPSATLRKRRQRALDRLRTIWRKLYGEH
jgi:RNA polymerase sigma-70 factor (ECF subfamily)